MAELAAGAVSSLLGIIRNEALLLSRVRGDARFIKHEMESMKSFLSHLARVTPPGTRHDEQVLTWMKQVEELAHDCRDCIIVLYRHHGDPEVYRAMGGIQRYVRWFPWFLRKMIDQHRAASRLVELKERARDISERRKRYDVEVTTKPLSSQAAGHVATAGALGYEEDDSDNEAPMATADNHCHPRLLEHSANLVDYCTEKLTAWQRATKLGGSLASLSIVVPENDYNIACDTVHKALVPYFDRTLRINLSLLHHRYSTGTPLDILGCILQECVAEGTNLFHAEPEILNKDEESKVRDKIQKIKLDIQQHEMDVIVADGPLSVLHQVLSGIYWQPWLDFEVYNPTRVAEILKRYMEGFEPKPSICLHTSQYEYVLRKVFREPDPSSQGKHRSSMVEEGNPPTTLNQDNINSLIHSHKIALQIIQEVLARPQVLGPGSNNSAVKEKAISSDSASPITSASKNAIGITNKAIAAAKEAKDKMDVNVITSLLKEQVLIQGLLNKIERQLKCKRTLIVLQDELNYISHWKETINALSILPGTSHGPNAVIVITTNNQKAKDFCYPQGEPITFSLVGLYNDIVLQLTRQWKTEDDKDNLKIFYDILEKCNPDELCMKMFAHAPYANPNRSYSELLMLHEALELSKGSLGATSNFKKMFKFSYNDLPKDYKSCLLYLAIFPQGYIIKRSTIVGRWVTDGLIDKEDWYTSVDHADSCFSTLINRWFIYAVDTGATGKVKSCVVGGQVHGIISKIAKKERILDTRLSYHLAHHFSILSGLQLSRSDSIDKFVRELHNYSPQLSLLKLLDLQGCKCFDKKSNYLKAICNNIPFLKYLSLRQTNITHLPREINNLHDLEILDIRQTSVPPKETRHVLLLKLRRLLAGDTDSSASGNGTGITNRKQKSVCSCVSIPYKIEKMENLEVLSNVMASSQGNELKDISKLWQLRKFGVVINDNYRHFFNLLQAIGDLKECLQSVSITIAETRTKETSTEQGLLPSSLYIRLIQPPKILESLSITGCANRVRILSILAKGSNELAKVVLSQKLMRELQFMEPTAGTPDAAATEYLDLYGQNLSDEAVDKIKKAACLGNKKLVEALAAIATEMGAPEMEVL